MRRPLVRDAIRLSCMAYWDGERLEKFKSIDKEIKESDKEEDKDEKNTLVEEPPKKMGRDDKIRMKLQKPLTFISTAEDAQCYVTRYDDGCCMVFRGTTSTKDWLMNLDALQDPLNLPSVFGKERPKVHGGFLRQFQSLQMTLMQHANEYMKDDTIKDSNRTMYYFGHSLGGALATIAATVFGAMFPNVRHVCITFGAPRVGDTTFANVFRKNVDECVRCVNQEDPVPAVPSACNYEHVYGIVYIDKDQKLQDEITENRLLNTCRDSFLCCCGIAENPTDDHGYEQYEAAWNNIEE